MTTSLTYSEIKERCRTWRDVAMSLKLSLEEPFERVVLQRAIDRAHDVIPHGSADELIAATENLEAVVRMYRPPGPPMPSVPAPRKKTVAARTRAALQAAVAQKETA